MRAPLGPACRSDRTRRPRGPISRSATAAANVKRSRRPLPGDSPLQTSQGRTLRPPYIRRRGRYRLFALSGSRARGALAFVLFFSYPRSRLRGRPLLLDGPTREPRQLLSVHQALDSQSSGAANKPTARLWRWEERWDEARVGDRTMTTMTVLLKSASLLAAVYVPDARLC